MNAAHWPQAADTPLVTARKVAIIYREHLHTANPRVCAAVDDAMDAAGIRWVVPRLVTYEMTSLVLIDEAAEIAGVGVEALRKWRSRGYLGPDGQRHYLKHRDRDDQKRPLFEVRDVLTAAAATRSRRQ